MPGTLPSPSDFRRPSSSRVSLTSGPLAPSLHQSQQKPVCHRLGEPSGISSSLHPRPGRPPDSHCQTTSLFDPRPTDSPPPTANIAPPVPFTRKPFTWTCTHRQPYVGSGVPPVPPPESRLRTRPAASEEPRSVRSAGRE